jgi:hypothetical protein
MQIILLILVIGREFKIVKRPYLIGCFDMSAACVAEFFHVIMSRRATAHMREKYRRGMSRAVPRSTSSCGVTVFFILLV